MIEHDESSASKQDALGKNNYRNKIKKRKRKFIANVKGFGKRGNFGRGTHLENDEWSYYINIMDTIKAGFVSIEDKRKCLILCALTDGGLALYNYYTLYFLESMAENVLEQTIDKEIHTSSNQVACTVIEHLLPFSDVPNFERYQKQFAGNFRPICSDKFASHILEKLVSISFLRGVAQIQPPVEPTMESSSVNGLPSKKQKPDIPDEKSFNLTVGVFSEEHRQTCREFVVKVSKFLLNNLEDFMWDTYASHIMRTCFDSLSGVFQVKKSFIAPAAEQASLSGDGVEQVPLHVPNEWIEVIQEYAIRLQSWPQFPDLPFNELSSGNIQSLCVALSRHDKNTLKHIGKRLLDHSFVPITTINAHEEEVDLEKKYSAENVKGEGTEDMELLKDLPSAFSTEPSIRCLEALILVAGPKLLSQIYAKLFCGRLVKLSLMKSANFAVQKLVSKEKVKENFEAIFDELSESFEKILQIGHTGVICALAQTCLRLSLKQGPFVQQLQTALDCLSPKEKSDKFALVTFKLKPYKVVLADTSNFVHIHGAIILQCMLKFNKPIKLVQCLLEMKNSVLAEIFSSPKGSHIVDAFIESKFIGEKSRERLVKHLMGCYIDMAISRHGSWAVEKLFNAADDQQKAKIVKELAEKYNQLNGSPSGRILNIKLRIDTYRLSPDQWRMSFNKETKAEKLFKDIL